MQIFYKNFIVIIVDNYSIPTIVRARRRLGWLHTKTRYCQHIRPKNIAARLEWAEKMEKQMNEGFDFSDVVFSDESKIQLEFHTKKCYRQEGQPVNIYNKMI